VSRGLWKKNSVSCCDRSTVIKGYSIRWLKNGGRLHMSQWQRFLLKERQIPNGDRCYKRYQTGSFYLVQRSSKKGEIWVIDPSINTPEHSLTIREGDLVLFNSAFFLTLNLCHSLSGEFTNSNRSIRRDCSYKRYFFYFRDSFENWEKCFYRRLLMWVIYGEFFSKNINI